MKEVAAQSLPEVDASHLDVLSWDQWLAREFGPPDWLIPGLLERGAGGMIHGGPRSYKSFLCLQLCLDVAAGRSVLGLFAKQPPRRAFLLQAEGTPRAWRERMVALRSTYPPGIPFWSRHTSVEKLDTPGGDRRVREALTLLTPELLVVDPLSNFFTGADTDQVAIQRWFSGVDGWKTDFGCAVLIVHHDRQPVIMPLHGELQTINSGMYETRGNTRLPGWADLLIAVRRRGDVATIIVQKARDAPDGQEYSFRLKDGKLTALARGAGLEAAVLACIEPGEEMWVADLMKKVVERTQVSDRTARRSLNNLVSDEHLALVKAGGRFKVKRKEQK